MNPMPPSPAPQQRENADPHEAPNPIPRPVLLIVALMLAWAVAYFYIAWPTAPAPQGDRRTPDALAASAPSAGGTPDGAQLFAANCAACHQASGEGLPQVFPPLSGSEWVQGDPARLTQIVLHGVNGAITVRGQTYHGMMPAFGAKFRDEELAALLSHVRSSWSNHAPPVDVTLVAGARKATADRTGPWTGGDELQQWNPPSAK